jgi:hypothetical protein
MASLLGSHADMRYGAALRPSYGGYVGELKLDTLREDARCDLSRALCYTSATFSSDHHGRLEACGKPHGQALTRVELPTRLVARGRQG